MENHFRSKGPILLANRCPGFLCPSEGYRFIGEMFLDREFTVAGSS